MKFSHYTITKSNVTKGLLISLACSFLVACSVQEHTNQQTQSETRSRSVVIEEIASIERQPVDLSEEIVEREQAAATPAPKLPLTQTQRFDGALESHNSIRSQHGLAPLTWSEKLSNYSQEWANKLASKSRCVMRHRSGNPPHGENLYWSSAIVWSDGRREINPVAIREVVKMWGDEKKWYNYQANNCQPGQRCGHYTQIVWKDTTEVGCAMQVCPDQAQIWVCSYNPPGNFTGVRPY